MFPHLLECDLIIIPDHPVKHCDHQPALLPVHAVSDCPIDSHWQQLLSERPSPVFGVRAVSVHDHYLEGGVVTGEGCDEQVGDFVAGELQWGADVGSVVGHVREGGRVESVGLGGDL